MLNDVTHLRHRDHHHHRRHDYRIRHGHHHHRRDLHTKMEMKNDC